MHRFYHKHTDVIYKDDALYKYIVRVLRKQKSEMITLFDETKKEVAYKITHIDKTAVYMEEISVIENNFKIRYDIDLYQTIIEKKDFERAIDFATQVGVSSIYPLITEYSQPHFRYSDKLLERFRSIAIESSCQCGRLSIPDIKNIVRLDEVILEGFNLVLHNRQENKDIDISNVTKINLFVGPEGGFSQKDISYMKNVLHVKFLNLPTYILKSENAGGVGISILNIKSDQSDF